MANELSISNFSSLNFEPATVDNRNYLPHEYWKLSQSIDEPYVQQFIPSDSIRIQYSIAIDENTVINFVLRNNVTDEETPLTTELLAQTNDALIYAIKILGLDVGSYTVLAIDTTIPVSPEPIVKSDFCVVEELPDTLLLSYTNYRNEFDAIFDGIAFEFRIQAAFLPSDIAQNVEANSFRDQRYSSTQLSALPYETHTLTIGDNNGVPNWVARKLNLIFSTSAVTIDGTPYVRSEGSVPEINLLGSGYPLFVYKIDLEPTDNYSQKVSLYGEYLLAAEDDRFIITENGLYVDMNFYGQ